MFELGINWDLGQVDASFVDLKHRARYTRPAFRDLRVPMRVDQREHAKQEQGPDSKWPSRSPITEARRRHRNRGARTTKAMRLVQLGKSRRRTTPKKTLGRLPGAVVYTVGGHFIRATSRVEWSAAHAKGLRVGRGVRLKKRAWLWLSDQLLLKAANVLSDHVMKGWKR